MNRACGTEKKLNGILSRQRLLSISKEVFRKTIHLCSATIPFLASKNKTLIIVLLAVALVFYSVSEILRLSGKEVFIVSAITEAAARKRDENKFVLGPVTLVIGIILSLLLWHPVASSVGIYALAFGDGFASLAGKLFGRVKIPLAQGKTAAGSLTCFAAIFISCWFSLFLSPSVTAGLDISLIALRIAALGMFIEVLPLKDLDNVFIPVILGGATQFQLFSM